MSNVKICIVNDGEFCWGADWRVLRAAMEAQGWEEIAPGRWREPESDNDDDACLAYGRLCDAVPNLPGMGAYDRVGPRLEAGEFGDPILMRARPDWGADWEVAR